ncbi:MAG: 5'-methylthioadenosine/S-adenosylhomocysteine nucleosidase [Bdellovibrionaceae bacterium]|nr:5'-methylthioadenosine/S-adenosylhomocysteine nucleosidase [Pseudobdellovibrionaceae bacterium]
MSQLLILCPLPIEMKHLIKSFVKRSWYFEATGNLTSQNSKGGPSKKLASKRETSRISLYYSAVPSVTIGVGGHGKVQFGVQTQYLLGHLQDVSAVICLGAGGGLSENIKIGDIVISEKTIEHDYKQRFNSGGHLPEYFGHSELLAQAKRACGFSRDLDFDIHFGDVASGDEDIVDQERAGELYQKTKALAVAWEGIGGARACAFNSVPYLEVRAITDNARSTVRESFIQNLPICMDNAAVFIQRLLNGVV